jgi:predicted DNA-binding transcriptional regulator AlpA
MPIQISKGSKPELAQSGPLSAQAAPLRRMLSVEEAAHYLGVSVSWLNKSRCRGDGPPHHKIGRRVVYALADLDAFLAQQRRCHTSATMA